VRLGPVWVLSLNSGASQFPGERAHLECQEETLFPRHGTEDFKLDRLRLGTCIADGHGKMLSRKPHPVAQWLAGARVTDSAVDIQGRHLKLSNLEKVLYPATGFTKQQVIDYYARIAPAMIPHLAGRALTRKRYPDGVDGEPFFEKNAPMHKPEWVKTAPIWSGRNRRTVHYVLADDLATLVWLANLAALELHPSLALATDITCPTEMVFDLDPGPPANIVQCCQVGLWLREIFEHFGLQSFPKTSGSKGLQVYVPLNTPTTFDATKLFSHALAQLLEHEHPDLVLSEMSKQARAGKIFVDWSQNDEHKTTIAVYSLRAREHPTVSTPVTWDEVERAFKKKDAQMLVFEAKQAVARFERLGDLFEPVLELKQKLPDPKKAAVQKIPEAIEIAAQADEKADRHAKPKKKTEATVHKRACAKGSAPSRKRRET
jgi:bifunctional non-homologous end joining protein LigD